MIILGLFHGLIFLPVLLSLLGPDPYHTVGQTTEEDPAEEEEAEKFRPEFLTSKILSEGRETDLW